MAAERLGLEESSSRTGQRRTAKMSIMGDPRNRKLDRASQGKGAHGAFPEAKDPFPPFDRE